MKVGFLDKVTGLWAFEEQIPYQKYQGPPIVVRLTWDGHHRIWILCIVSLPAVKCKYKESWNFGS